MQSPSTGEHAEVCSNGFKWQGLEAEMYLTKRDIMVLQNTLKSLQELNYVTFIVLCIFFSIAALYF